MRHHPKAICLISIFIICSNANVKAQCPVANAGPDKSICLNAGGQSYADIGDMPFRNDLSYNWTPNYALDDYQSPITQASPSATTQEMPRFFQWREN